MTAEELSVAFCNVLKQWLTAEQYAEMILLNDTSGSVCHSHDYCDANQAMLDAFEAGMKREFDFENDEDLVLMNKAWYAARTARMYPPEVYRYKLTQMDASSSRYGPCEVCGKDCSDMWFQTEEKYYSYLWQNEKMEGWTQHKCHSYFGHKDCLTSKQHK